jgi:hypothetical protein
VDGKQNSQQETGRMEGKNIDHTDYLYLFAAPIWYVLPSLHNKTVTMLCDYTYKYICTNLSHQFCQQVDILTIASPFCFSLKCYLEDLEIYILYFSNTGF